MMLPRKLFKSTEFLNSSDFKLNCYITQILTGIFKLSEFILSSDDALTLEALTYITNTLEIHNYYTLTTHIRPRSHWNTWISDGSLKELKC